MLQAPTVQSGMSQQPKTNSVHLGATEHLWWKYNSIRSWKTDIQQG